MTQVAYEKIPSQDAREIIAFNSLTGVVFMTGDCALYFDQQEISEIDAGKRRYMEDDSRVYLWQDLNDQDSYMVNRLVVPKVTR